MVLVDSLIQAFVDNLAQQNEESAATVKTYLTDFDVFAAKELQSTPTEIIAKLKQGTFNDSPKEEQPYQVLSKYAGWLKTTKYDKDENNAHTLRLKISWARTLMETNFIPISRAVFKQQVKMPKEEEPELSPVAKKIVQKIMIATEDIGMQTYELWLGSMGWRATESFTVQNQNFEGLNLKTLKFEDQPSFVNIRGKTAKTKKGKRRRLTGEMRSRLEDYLAHKYRPRTINYFNRQTGKWEKKHLTPEAKPADYVFLPWHSNPKPKSKRFAKNAYSNTSRRFSELMDRMGIEYEESGKRHKVTLHTLRRFCFTTCKRLVDEGYAKYHIGRRVHEYDKATEEQIAEDFAAVEPHLTFFDTAEMERQLQGEQQNNKLLAAAFNEYKSFREEMRASHAELKRKNTELEAKLAAKGG